MHHKSHFRRSRKIYRSSNNKVVSGVCGGIGEYLDISASWVRFGVAVATLFNPPVVITLYIVCIFLMPTGAARPQTETTAGVNDPFWQTASQEDCVNRLSDSFDSLEKKIRRLEDHVTSKEYQLNRKFENL